MPRRRLYIRCSQPHSSAAPRSSRMPRELLARAGNFHLHGEKYTGKIPPPGRASKGAPVPTVDREHRMWAYIVTATRERERERRGKNLETMRASKSDDTLFKYHDRMFTISDTPEPVPGPSGVTPKRLAKSNKSHLNAPFSPLHQLKKKARTTTAAQRRFDYRLEDGIDFYEDPDSDMGSTGNCLSRLCSRFYRLCRRRNSEERGIPPDWFLDQFAAQTFDDPDDPIYHTKPSKWLCGLKLAFDPTEPGHYQWLAVVSLAILYNIIFVIGRSVFWELDQMSPIWFLFDYICDFIYIVDTIVHMHEGYLEQGLMVKDSEMLRRHYINSNLWHFDLISLIPTDIAYYWWRPGTCNDVSLPCPVIVRMNRLFRLPRMSEWCDRTETATSFPNAFRICKVVMAIILLIHWNACIFFAISYTIGFGSDNWVYNNTGNRNQSLSHQYIYSFYWSTLTLTTIGETPQPEMDTEYIFVVADFLAGVLIFATIVGNIGSMITNMNVARVDFQNKMDGVKQYMSFRKITGELEERVIRWFDYTWNESGALDEEQVLALLPDKLKAEIAIRVHLEALRKVRIFYDCEPGLLEALVLKLKLQVFSPGDYICRKGDVGKEMYIVKRGRLQVVADDGKTVLATLSAGSVFGEVSVLDIAGNRTGNRRTANVRALGYSDLFCLAKKDLWEALADYPDARATLTARGCQLLRKDGLLDETVFQNAQTTQQSLEETVHKLESTVEIMNNRLQGLLTNVGKEQAKINQRINKLETRIIHSDDDDSDSEDRTSSDNSELLSEVAAGYDSADFKGGRFSAAQGPSMLYLNHPVRERGYSLTVERSPGLLHAAPQPRSKSLRLKRFHKDVPQ